MYNPDNHSYLFNNVSGRTIINGCTEQLTTSIRQLRTDTIDGTSTLIQPFWQTVVPMIFAVAISVTVAYVLLLVTIMARSRRPWLQKVAALSAAVSLTLAADLMLSELRREHQGAVSYNTERVRDIRTNDALKVLRIISNMTMWLAQVQVLIRLFPRHRDKVIIKWTGLCLIVLQVVFSVLNDFIHPSPVNPNSTNAIVPAIPVLAYLFHIAIGVVYAVCVLFYTLTNGRWRHAYAPRNLIVAGASIFCIVSPVVFFCLDIWNDRVEGWGDYVRWSACVAASVIVWDWVDHTEARITKDSKTGILGREIFEDEMYDGGKKQKTGEAASKSTSRLFRAPWKKTTASRRSNSPDLGAAAIELPIIHHPMARSTSPSTLLGPSAFSSGRSRDGSLRHNASTMTIGSADNADIDGQFRDLSREHARQYAASEGRLESDSAQAVPSEHSTSNSRSRSQQELGRPVVHPGFSEQDYWLDEKT